MIEKADHEKLDKLSEICPFGEIIIKLYRGKAVQIRVKDDRIVVDKKDEKEVRSG